MTMAVGFSQRIALPWLHRAAEMALAGMPLDQATQELTDVLGEHLSQDNNPQRGNRDKAVTILRRIWLVEEPATITLRDAALAHWTKATAAERIALHWGMAAATYPFWATVADIVGRLLAINGRVALKQVQQRLRESLGARETVARASRRIWSTMHDWGTLKTGADRRFTVQGSKRLDIGPKVSIWLAEGMVASARGETCAVAHLDSLPSLYPFTIHLPERIGSHLTPATVLFQDSDGSYFLRTDSADEHVAG